MLKLLFGLARFGFVAGLGLAAGSLIEWDGSTLAERVRIGILAAKPAEAGRDLRNWAGKTAGKIEDTVRHVASGREVPESREERGPDAGADHGITGTERAKLRALIKDLGGSSRRK